jgi:hypothetical protein
MTIRSNTPGRILAAIIALGGNVHSAGPSAVIAALKDNEVVLVDRASGSVTKLAGDPRGKWALRWLPDGRRISYLVNGQDGDKIPPGRRIGRWPRLVISDLTGHVTQELALTPAANSANPESIRAIEDAEWLSNRLLRLEGSFGPRNCAVFEVDIDTGRALTEHDVECGSLTLSPDGEHVAYLFPVSMGTWDDRIHRVEIDDGPARTEGARGVVMRSSVGNAPVSYAGDPGAPIHLEAGPLWSEDSHSVALLERQVPAGVGRGEVVPQPQNGQMAVTTISITGEVIRVPVPANTRDDPTLTWIGSRVAVGTGSNALVVDPASRTYLPVDVDSAGIIQRAEAARQKVLDDRHSVEEVLRKLGAREGVASPN